MRAVLCLVLLTTYVTGVSSQSTQQVIRELRSDIDDAIGQRDLGRMLNWSGVVGAGITFLTGSFVRTSYGLGRMSLETHDAFIDWTYAAGTVCVLMVVVGILLWTQGERDFEQRIDDYYRYLILTDSGYMTPFRAERE